MPIGRLHVLTDYFFQQRYSHAELARRAIAGGADTIQFRQKKGDVRHLVVELRRVIDVCAAADVPLLVNDRIDLALLPGVAGVHLGQDDFPVGLARELLGPDVVIGATATTTAQAVQAEREGASYIGFGPVFTTSSKINPASVKGVAGLAHVCEAVSIPVIAIAGITAERVAEAMSAGAYGVAVMTAVTLAPDPEAATRELANSMTSPAR